MTACYFKISGCFRLFLRNLTKHYYLFKQIFSALMFGICMVLKQKKKNHPTDFNKTCGRYF